MKIVPKELGFQDEDGNPKYYKYNLASSSTSSNYSIKFETETEMPTLETCPAEDIYLSTEGGFECAPPPSSSN